MLKVIVCRGVPASGKSFWAKQQIVSDPSFVRINNDDLRASLFNSQYSKENETVITHTRLFLIREALKANKSVAIDNVNSNKKHLEDVLKIVKELNIDCEVSEKTFYIDIEEAVARDDKREGSARVGRKVIQKFYNDFGKEKFKDYEPKTFVFKKNLNKKDAPWEPMKQDESLPKSIICDLDGTLALIGDRSPYDASKCDLVDIPNVPVVNIVKMYYDKGYEIIFCSGREQKDEIPTRRFIDRNLPDLKYHLFMRQTSNKRADNIVKQEIFDTHIKNKFYVEVAIDDRLKVARLWWKMGINLLRAGDPDASF